MIGFNNSRFDNKVLSAYTDFDLNSLPTLDILQEVKKQLGYRLSLDGLASQTLGAKKSADGLQALKWYKEGRIDKIIDYCRQDVKVTCFCLAWRINICSLKTRLARWCAARLIFYRFTWGCREKPIFLSVLTWEYTPGILANNRSVFLFTVNITRVESRSMGTDPQNSGVFC